MLWERCTLLKVVDGDTIDVVIDVGFYHFTQQRLRFRGVNTPERGQPGYAEARDYVQKRMTEEPWFLITHKADKYGRFLCDVKFTSGTLNDELIANGLAVPYNP